MFSFLRVIVFYLGVAALLTWAVFALGLADNLELPGFESARTPETTPKIAVATSPRPAQAPVVDGTVKEALRQDSAPAQASAPERPRAASVEPLPSAVVPSSPTVSGPSIAKPSPAAPKAPEATAPAVPATAPPAGGLPSIRVPTLEARPPLPMPEAKSPATEVVSAPMRPVAPPSRAEPPAAVAPPVQPVHPVQPVPQRRAEPVVVAPAPAPTAPAASPPPPATPPAATRAPQVGQPAPAAGTRRWAPMKRIAGFGADALVDQLEETRRAGDDIACVVFRGLVFKAGSTTFTPRALQELDTVARALLTVPEKRVEIGSRLGPGRPMASDARLRLDRARLVRERLISRGVAPGRLLIDEGEGYERVADDLTRAGGTRVQSMGLCVHHA